jgi:Ca2+-binding RTX toxin-like protein
LVGLLVAGAVALVAVFLVLPQAANAAAARRCDGKEATIVGTARADLLKGTARRDVIVGLGGNDTIKGLGGNDRICGGKGNDTLLGGRDTDLLRGDEGNDKLSGGSGQDYFLAGGPGADALNGGGGGDLAWYSEAPGPVTVDLAAGTAVGDGSDTLANIEHIEGSDHDDTLIGNAASNALFAGEGNDTVSGDDGNDLLFGREGDDALDGGSGEDLIWFDSQFGVTANLTTGTATGEGSDTVANIEDIVGSHHDDTLTGDTGPNVFWPRRGNDAIDGSGGEDWVSFEFSSAPITADLSAGSATGEGTDTLAGIENLFGSVFDDALTGDAGPTKLAGWNGNDTLSGGDGDDTLIGDEGTDTLDGGNATDTCDGESEVNCEA